MLFNVVARNQDDHVKNIAAFPLAIPLMAGPGAITATILLSGRAGNNLAMLGVLLGVIAVVIVTICTFLAQLAIERGQTTKGALS